MAVQTPPELESHHRVLREGAGLLDRSARGKLDVAGPDALEYLQGQVTNDVEGLAPGEGCYAALLNPKGKILADMRVLVRARDELWLDTEAGALEALLSKLDMYRIGRRVELADRSEERAILSLIGPGARAAAGVELPEREHAFIDAEVEGLPVVVAATDLGVDLVVDRNHLEAIRSALATRGVVPVSEAAAEIVRIESGRPRYGIDMTADNLPGEIGIEQRAVSFTKGCYVGQEPVARMHYRGHPNRRLRGLMLSEQAAPDERLFKEQKEIGRLTSACVSRALGPIALALLRREVEPGQEVRVGDAGVPARVVELPFETGRQSSTSSTGSAASPEEVDRLG
jgi:tRNA-modifying protein YgfZ